MIGEGEVPDGAGVAGAPEIPGEGDAILAAEVLDDGAVEIGSLDPDAMGIEALEEIREGAGGFLGVVFSAGGGKGAVSEVEPYGVGTKVAVYEDLEPEARDDKEFVNDGEIVAVEDEDADLGDDGVGAGGEGFEVEDGGVGGLRIGDWRLII